jgi:tetratricopeptide (TPR) repeat protein
MTELEIWNELGNIYYNAGAFNKAIRTCQKMIALDPGYGLPYINLASIYVCQRRYMEAVPLFQKAIGLLGEATNQAFLWKKLGDAYRKLEDYGNASASYRKAIELDPENSLFQEKLAEVELAFQKSDPGSLNDTDPNKPASIDPEIGQAGDAGNVCWVFKGNDAPEQEEKESPPHMEQSPVILGSRILSDAVVEEAVPEASVLLEQASVYNQVPAEESLRSTRTENKELRPDNLADGNSTIDPAKAQSIEKGVHTLLRLAILHRRKRENERALQFIEMALERAKDSKDAFLKALCHYAMAQVDTDLGKIEDAIQFYQSSVNLAPEHVFPWNAVGNLNCLLDRYEDAQAAFQEAIDHNPKDPTSWNGLGDVYHKLGRVEDAISAYQLGNAFEEQENKWDILKEFEKTIDSEQGNPQVWIEAGDIYYDGGAYEDAIASYQKAFELDPTNPIVQANLEKARRVLDANTTSKITQTVPGTKAETLPHLESSSLETTIPQAEASNTLEKDPNWGESTPNDELMREELASRQDKITDSESEAAYWMFKNVISHGSTQQPSTYKRPEDTEMMVSTVESIPVYPRRTQPEQTFPGNLLLQGASEDRASILIQLPPRVANPVRTEESINKPVPNPFMESGSKEMDKKRFKFPFDAEEIKAAVSASHAAEKENRDESQSLLDLQIHKNDIAAYRRVTELNPQNDRAWDALGNKYESAGLHNEAITAFEKAISLDPQREVYHYHLGIALAYLEKYEQAIQALQKVITINPKYMLAHCALAGYYRRLGMEAEAQEHIKLARPGIVGENEYNQACFESISGDADRAIAFLEIALEKKQIQPDLVRSDPDLDFIRKDPRFETLLLKNGIISQ